jgi:HAD superfamily hydrolase (TIGR01549 family)
VTIETILLDMGNTLIEFEPEPFTTLHEHGLDAVRRTVVEAGWVPPESAMTISEQFSGIWNRLSLEHEMSGGQPHLGEAFSALLSRWGVMADPSRVERLEWAHYSVFRPQLALYDDVIHVLEACRDRGLRLALISNTIWPGHWHREDLRAFGIDHFFDYMVFSREFGRMKPHPAIVMAALEALGTAPERAVMVGDRVSADVAAARAAGCHALLRRHPHTYEDHPRSSEPDAEIDALVELLDWLDRRATDRTGEIIG